MRVLEEAEACLDQLDTPCPVVALDVLEANVRAMAERMRGRGVSLRPHFKTHKTVEIARLQQEHGWCAGQTCGDRGDGICPAGARRGRERR